MAAESLFPAVTAGGGVPQLIARDCQINMLNCIIDDALNKTLKRGTIISGAGPGAVFVLPTHAAMPAATDILAIVAEETVLATGAGDRTVGCYITGEFIRETVKAATVAASATIDDTDMTTLHEALIRQGANLVTMAYGDLTDVPTT